MYALFPNFHGKPYNYVLTSFVVKTQIHRLLVISWNSVSVNIFFLIIVMESDINANVW